MKFANVHRVLPSGRIALRLALFSFLCLLVFTLSSPRFPQAQAAGAATQQKRATRGKTNSLRTKAVSQENVKSLDKGAIKAAGDVQPKTVCAQNQAITFGQTINGSLDNGDCLNPVEGDNTLADEYTFNGTAGQQLSISMSSGAFDTVLYLLRPDGTVLDANDDVNPDGRPPDTNSRVPVTGFITLPSNGVYSILANAFRPEERGAYSVTLTGGATCSLTSIAFGATASASLNQGDCMNFIDDDGTLVDLFTFNGTAGQQISVTMSATSANGVNPYLYLVLPNGDLLAENDDGGGGTTARLPQFAGTFGRLPVSGVYTIVANTVLTGQTGNYNLTLSQGDNCTSTPLAINGTANAALAGGDCRLLEDGSFLDAYTFSGTSGQRVVITMTSNSAGLVPAVFLLSPTGTVLAIQGAPTNSNTARIPAGTATFPLPSTGNYTILANSFAPNQTGNYTLQVSDPAACSTTLAATSRDVNGGGGAFVLGLTTQAGCPVTATSNSPFISVGTPTVDANGAGTVPYNVQANPAATTRTGTITINGQTFTVTQGAALACAYTLYPAISPFINGGGDGRFTVITTSACAWTATSNAPWITITPGFASGTGTGRVRYTVAVNNVSTTRTGTINVNGQTHTVTQTSTGTTPTIQFSGTPITGNVLVPANENEPANTSAKSAFITVTRTGDTAGAATVEYATVDNPAAIPCNPENTAERGIAYARCDYSSTVDTLTFGIGETSKTFTVPLINDVHVEGNEFFDITLRSPQGATLGAATAARVTITDNDFVSSATNPINATTFFVRLQYLDFLTREPEAGEPWSAVLNNCSNVNNNPACDRITVSGAFFGSPEFRLKGFFVFLYYKATFGSTANPNYVPTYDEFVPDTVRVSGLTGEEVIAKRLDFSEDWLARQTVANVFGGTTNAAFVDRALANLGIALTNADPESGQTRNSLVTSLDGGTRTRAQVLRIIVESTEAVAAHFNRAFVAIQYYGYLRRTPEAQGYQNNLTALNNTNDSRQLINGFLNSIEYRWRFGPNSTQ